MGIYVNPNNRKFCKVLKAGNYVDKTGLISYINSVLGTKDCETVFTRPRRFSKTTACKMLEAYYSAGADSEDLFKGREIEKDPTYREHLNKHPVISFDLLAFKDKRKKLKPKKENPAMINDYIAFLRSLFRSQDTDLYLAGVYMTGILPIIRYNTHSALSDFRERTMINPGPLARYVGFTQEDVRKVCDRFGADEQLMKDWYDGYNLPSAEEVYCPSSVMEAAKNDDYSSHWSKTSAMEALTDYIYTDLDGVYDAMNKLLDGRKQKINPDTFQNRLDQVNTKDKVLTVLVHLGYLAYDYRSNTVRIPNLEIRQQMLDAFAGAPNEESFKRVHRCNKVIEAARDMDNQTIARLLKEIHDERPPIHYNNEQALRYVVLDAFNLSPNALFTSFEELSSGQGYVDILFKPLKKSSDTPMLVELKHGESTNKAISQINEKDYIAHLRKAEYHGNVLLIGINYSPHTKEHTCRIELIRI